MKKLKARWGISSDFQLAIIFIVFAITGSASAWSSKLVCNWIGLTPEILGGWFLPVRLVLIFPLYQVLLVLIGTIFGQFNFFWKFEKKMLRAMGLGFLLQEKR